MGAYPHPVPRVRVENTVDVPREALFAVLSDHAGYDRFPGITGSELIQPGTQERNGLGAVRRIRLGGPTVLDEEIVAYDAPNSFEYRITRARPLPLHHTLGRVEFIAIDPNHTKVVWTSEFDIPVPIVGRSIGKYLEGRLSRGFKAAIRAAAALA